jgi:hypothetical protein
MAYLTTTYPAKAALKSALEAWTWPSGAPDIRWGEPTEQEDVTYDLIAFGPTDVPDDAPLTLGATSYAERYTIRVLIQVMMWGDDEQATEARAWDHFNQLLTLVRSNRTLSGTVREAQTFTFQQTNPIVTPSMWQSQILVEISVLGVVFT